VSDVTIYQDPELTKAADDFLEGIKGDSCGSVNGVPLFVEWVLRHAFERGVAWQQSREAQK
jgi:hypothetical protein